MCRRGPCGRGRVVGSAPRPRKRRTNRPERRRRDRGRPLRSPSLRDARANAQAQLRGAARRGAIPEGEHADLAILDRGGQSSPDAEIRDTTSTLRAAGGRVAYATEAFAEHSPSIPALKPASSPVNVNGGYGSRPRECRAAGSSSAARGPSTSELAASSKSVVRPDLGEQNARESDLVPDLHEAIRDEEIGELWLLHPERRASVERLRAEDGVAHRENCARAQTQ